MCPTHFRLIPSSSGRRRRGGGGRTHSSMAKSWALHTKHGISPMIIFPTKNIFGRLFEIFCVGRDHPCLPAGQARHPGCEKEGKEHPKLKNSLYGDRHTNRKLWGKTSQGGGAKSKACGKILIMGGIQKRKSGGKGPGEEASHLGGRGMAAAQLKTLRGHEQARQANKTPPLPGKRKEKGLPHTLRFALPITQARAAPPPALPAPPQHASITHEQIQTWHAFEIHLWLLPSNFPYKREALS